MIQTFKFDTPLHALKMIAHLLAAQIQFTCTFEAGQIHICYPVGAEASLPQDLDATWERILNVLEHAKLGAVL